jgi:hypothetical protein
MLTTRASKAKTLTIQNNLNRSNRNNKELVAQNREDVNPKRNSKLTQSYETGSSKWTKSKLCKPPISTYRPPTKWATRLYTNWPRTPKPLGYFKRFHILLYSLYAYLDII